MFWKSSSHIQTNEKPRDHIITDFWEFQIDICEFWNVLMTATVNGRKCLYLLVQIAFWRIVAPWASDCFISILFSSSLSLCSLFLGSFGLLAGWHASIPSNIGDCSIWDLLCPWNCEIEVLICSHRIPRKVRFLRRSWRQGKHCTRETSTEAAVSLGRLRLLKSWLVRSSGSWIACSASCFLGYHTRLLGCGSTSRSPDRLFCDFSPPCMAAGMSRAWLAPLGPKIPEAGQAFLPLVGSLETGNRSSLRCLCASLLPGHSPPSSFLLHSKLLSLGYWRSMALRCFAERSFRAVLN